MIINDTEASFLRADNDSLVFSPCDEVWLIDECHSVHSPVTQYTVAAWSGETSSQLQETQTGYSFFPFLFLHHITGNKIAWCLNFACASSTFVMFLILDTTPTPTHPQIKKKIKTFKIWYSLHRTDNMILNCQSRVFFKEPSSLVIQPSQSKTMYWHVFGESDGSFLWYFEDVNQPVLTNCHRTLPHQRVDGRDAVLVTTPVRLTSHTTLHTSCIPFYVIQHHVSVQQLYWAR